MLVALLIFYSGVSMAARSDWSDLLTNKDIQVTTEDIQASRNSSTYKTAVFRNIHRKALKKVDYRAELDKSQMGAAVRISEYYVVPNPLTDKTEEAITTNAINRNGKIEARTSCGGKTTVDSFLLLPRSSTNMEMKSVTTTPDFCRRLKIAFNDKPLETMANDIKECSEKLKAVTFNPAVSEALNNREYKARVETEMAFVKTFQGMAVEGRMLKGSTSQIMVDGLGRQNKTLHDSASSSNLKANEAQQSLSTALADVFLIRSALEDCALIARANGTTGSEAVDRRSSNPSAQ